MAEEINTRRRVEPRGAAECCCWPSLAAAGLVSSLASAATLDEIKQRGYMVVVTEDDFRPFEFVKDGKPTGFDNEMIEKLRKFAPFEIQQEIIPWTGFWPASAPASTTSRSPPRSSPRNGMQSLDFSMPIAAVDGLLPQAQETTTASSRSRI